MNLTGPQYPSPRPPPLLLPSPFFTNVLIWYQGGQAFTGYFSDTPLNDPWFFRGVSEEKWNQYIFKIVKDCADISNILFVPQTPKIHKALHSVYTVKTRIKLHNPPRMAWYPRALVRVKHLSSPNSLSETSEWFRTREDLGDEISDALANDFAANSCIGWDWSMAWENSYWWKH